MSSKIGIWNMALGFLGTRTVAAEDENTPEAIQCGLYWDNARRQALRDFPWNFAQRRAWLAPVAVPAGWDREYRHAYALPVDCLKAIQVLHEGQSESHFVLAHDAARTCTVVLTNVEAALLCYSADVQQVQVFDDLFQSVLARKLSALLCIPLLKASTNTMVELEKLYRDALAGATGANASERLEQVSDDSWLMARC